MIDIGLLKTIAHEIKEPYAPGDVNAETNKNLLLEECYKELIVCYKTIIDLVEDI